ncbi:hypothetical protein [Leifsonia naganoensis]|uniref:Uncharacterized protein n=1 Tax=Leifsonia naganoensis TaxID=150025 RepID=A0A853DKX2_9MICO|nr:hypothetical protein [Leifsonia naganoensis]
MACIKMAGPVADFAYLVDRDGEKAALEATVDGWRELLVVDGPDDDALLSDQAGAASTGAMAYGFAWAAGFFEANRDLISELGEMLRGADGYLGLDATAGRLQGADQAELNRMFAKVSAHTSTVEDVQAHRRELSHHTEGPPCLSATGVR